MRCSPRNGFGGNSSLPIGRSRQRQHGFLSREHVLHFDDIAHRPDLRIGGAHLCVNDNTATRPDFQAGDFSEHGFGPNAYRQDDEIGKQARSTLRNDNQAAAVALLDARQTVAQVELYALRSEMFRQRYRHLRIERRHQLGQFLQHRNRQLAMDQILDHLQADEAAADHDCSLGAPFSNPWADAAGVRDRAHGENAGQIHAR